MKNWATPPNPQLCAGEDVTGRALQGLGEGGLNNHFESERF